MTLLFLMLGVALLLLLLAALRWYAAAPPQQVVAGLRWIAYLGGGAAAVFLVMSGRAAQLIYIAIPFLPLLRRWWRSLRGASGGGGGTAARSDVETPWLRMTLDHAAATMDGLVLQGSLAGRRLSELRADQLLELLGSLRIEHPESATLLEAYLDAVHAGWRAAADAAADAAGDGEAATSPRDEMSREEAYQILGLAPGADDEAVRRAWREAMKRNHPDHGGSPYLAAKINRAKERLLGA
ncbi:MAG: molecular chaperone DnaJ [Alphaproteobacteria bacterium]|nr:molecular chaperone DnaJ [Alphaproteobacteria bacterium]